MQLTNALPTILAVALSIRMSSLFIKSKLLHSRYQALKRLPLINATSSGAGEGGDEDDVLLGATSALADAHYSRRWRSFGYDGNRTASTAWTSTALEDDVFASLRSKFKISNKQHNRRLSGNFRHFKSNSKGAARAGTLFFFSYDGAYLIKTIQGREREALLRMLPSYKEYIEKNGKSLMTRFCGMYDIEMKQASSSSSIFGLGWWWRRTPAPMTVVVMNSIFPVNAKITERFDLKGSTVGRKCSSAEKEKKGSDAVLKDLDLAEDVEVELMSDWEVYKKGWGLNIGHKKKRKLLNQLRRDVEFLEKEMVRLRFFLLLFLSSFCFVLICFDLF